MSISEPLSILENPDVSIALGKLIIALSLTTSETEVYATVASYLPELLPAVRSSIALLADEGKNLEIFALNGTEGVIPLGKKVPCEGTGFGLAVRTRQPQFHWANPQSPLLDIAQLSQNGIASFACVPLIVHDQAIGTIGAAFSDPTLTSDQILNLFTQISSLISTHLERQMLLKQTQVAMEGYRSQAEQLQVLNEIARKLSAAISDEEVFDAIAKAIKQIIPVERVSYAIPTPELKGFRIFRFTGDAYLPTDMVLPKEKSGLGFIYDLGQPYFFAELSQSDFSEHAMLMEAGLRCGWSVPVNVVGEITGILNAASSKQIKDGNQLLSILTTLAELMGSTFERIRLQDQAATVLRDSEEQVRTFIDGSPLLLLALDTKGMIHHVSHFGASQLGYLVDHLIGSPFSSLHPDDQAEQIQAYLQTLSNLDIGEIHSREAQMLQGDGTFIWARQNAHRVHDHQGIPQLLLACEDISKVRSLTDQLHFMAHHDALTTLPNHTLFRHTLEALIAKTADQPTPFAMLFIDLDGFKKVNDSLSHAIGNELLCQVAQRLQAVVTSSDTVARLGGDEFVVLLPQAVSPDEAAKTAQAILTQLRTPFQVQNHDIFIGASIGISLYPDQGKTSSELMKQADLAMYRAKAQGRNNYQFYSAQLSATLQRKLAIEHALRTAIEKDELHLVFQPQVGPAGQILGLEALVRWHHPTLGIVPPSTFIPIAEESHLIAALTDWVLKHSLATLVPLRSAYPHLYVAVNISAQEFLAPCTLVNRVRRALAAHKLPGSALELEITESVFLHPGEGPSQLLTALKTEGVRIAIDDFGTGFSSLAYLLNLPFDTLKIDRTFVNDIDIDPTKEGIMKGILTIANSLGVTCVAEGIESLSQLKCLQKLGCSHYQGYYFQAATAIDQLRPLMDKKFRV